VKHLHAHHTSFGVGSNLQAKRSLVFAQAFDEYVEDVVSSLPDWITGRLLNIRDPQRRDASSKVLSGIQERIRFALTSSTFNSACVGLELPTSTPILCRGFLVDMGTYLYELSSPLMEVFRMLEPMFPCVHIEGKSNRMFKDQPSAMLENFISENEPKSESRQVFHQVSTVCIIPHASLTSPQLLSIIFRHRTLALAKIDHLDDANPPKNPPRHELTGRVAPFGRTEPSTADSFFRQDKAIQSFLKSFRHAKFKGSKADLKIKSQIAEQDELRATLEGLPYGEMLLRILAATKVRWSDCAASTMCTVAKTVSGYALTTLWFHINYHMYYIMEDEVQNLREDIDRLFDESLRSWTGFWDGWIVPPRNESPSPSQSGIAVPHEMQNALNEGVATLVRLLLRKEIAAVPGEDKYGRRTILIAGNVYDAAENLLKASTYTVPNYRS
jgi:hypothetical protein